MCIATDTQLTNTALVMDATAVVVVEQVCSWMSTVPVPVCEQKWNANIIVAVCLNPDISRNCCLWGWVGGWENDDVFWLGRDGWRL